MRTAVVGNVARGATHDGPGLRSVVFFKGCPLRCPWCHNPELLNPKPEIVVRGRCTRCGECVSACPEGAIKRVGPPEVELARCVACGVCVPLCPSAARAVIGRSHDVNSLLALILRDQPWFEASGGGVTLSGGEPTSYAEFCCALVRRLRELGIHSTLETCGAFAWNRSALLLELVDLIFYDLKIADPVAHRRITGVDNGQILDNLERLLRWRPDSTVVRIPIIPSYTEDEQNLRALSMLLRRLKARRIVLLPCNPLASHKERRTTPAALDLERWRGLFSWADEVRGHEAVTGPWHDHDTSQHGTIPDTP